VGCRSGTYSSHWQRAGHCAWGRCEHPRSIQAEQALHTRHVAIRLVLGRFGIGHDCSSVLARDLAQRGQVDRSRQYGRRAHVLRSARRMSFREAMVETARAGAVREMCAEVEAGEGAVQMG
jgi:hypothetical protein